MKTEQMLEIIARVRSDFSEKFGIPRQSGLVDELKARIVFEEKYRNPDYLRGIEEFSHLWLLWQFSESVGKGNSPTVRPPRLGGNKRVGVFATRSPFRPNSIGLSSVKLERVEKTEKEGVVLHISGADLMDNTPVFDIKPYLPYTDSHPDATGGFTDRCCDSALQVNFPPKLLALLPEEKQKALLGVLSRDPRPSYISDSERVYGLSFSGFEIRFSVSENEIRVIHVQKNNE